MRRRLTALRSITSRSGVCYELGRISAEDLEDILQDTYYGNLSVPIEAFREEDRSVLVNQSVRHLACYQETWGDVRET